ncbi:hypothetical protein PCE1_000917 [Barthelona sp. PCE]
MSQIDTPITSTQSEPVFESITPQHNTSAAQLQNSPIESLRKTAKDTIGVTIDVKSPISSLLKKTTELGHTRLSSKVVEVVVESMNDKLFEYQAALEDQETRRKRELQERMEEAQKLREARMKKSRMTFE